MKSKIFFCLVLIWISNAKKFRTDFTNNSTGCSCAGGQISLYNYEVIPTEANSDVGCIGGCGGAPFSFHDLTTTVKTLRVWDGGADGGLKAIYVELFNGKVGKFGQTPTSGPNAQITFAAGESIVGDLELCGNGIGTRTGYIHFKTSAGQEFKVGNEHTPYYFPSGNSFLTGFFGQAGSDIDQLGFYMMKTIKDSNLRNLSYPTLDSYTQGLIPQIYRVVLCNDDAKQSQTQTATFDKETGTSYTWSVSLSFTFGEKITVEAGIPEIAKVSTEFHWEVGVSSTYSQTVDTKKTVTMNYPVTVPPRDKIYGTFTWWDSLCNVPYTANLVYTFTDNSQYTFKISDTFKGAFITDAQDSYHSEPLKPGENCSVLTTTRLLF